MFNFLRSPFKRPLKTVSIEPTPAPDSILAYYMPADGRGKVYPIKSSGYGAGMGSFSSRWESALQNNQTGYAAAFVASVWANTAVTKRARSISRMPVKVVRKGTTKEIVDHPLTVAMNRNKQRVLRKIEWSQLIWGETFILPRKNQFEYYSDVTWLNNLGMDVQHYTGKIDRFIYNPLEGGRVTIFDPEKMCYIKTDNPFSDIRGLSKFESIMLEIGIDVDIARTTRTFYLNDARPGVLLIPENDMNIADSREFMDYWKANFQGSKNAGKPVLLPKDIKQVIPMERPPSADDADLRQSVRREIAAAFEVPLALLGAWDDANYDSVDTQRKSYYEELIIPQSADIAAELTMRLLPFFDDTDENEVYLDPSEFTALTENQLEKSQIYNGQLTSGGISLNEWRKNHDLPPLANGNVHFIPSTSIQVKADDIGEVFGKPSYLPFGNPSVTPQQASDMARQSGIDSPMVASDPAQPAPTLPAGATEDTAQKATKSLCAMLSLEQSPDLIALRQRVGEMLPGIPVEWNNPESYHVTLLVAPSVTDEQVSQFTRGLARIAIPELNLNIGSLATFDDLARHALHFRIRKNANLEALQEQVYQLAQSIGIQTRLHHTPAQYTPHITLGYAPGRIRSVTFHTPVMLTPSELEVSTGVIGSSEYETVYEMPLNEAEIQEGQVSEITAEDELKQWEKKALNKGAAKARDFASHAIPEHLKTMVIEGLTEGLDKAGIKALFEAVKQAPLPTPEDILKYWKRYDALLAKVGNVWLSDYMRQAWRQLKRLPANEVTPTLVEETLTPMHEGVLGAWVGTPDKPGTLAKILLAGMAAGNEALRGVNPIPGKAELDLNISWDLMSEEAYQFVKDYCFRLIRGIDSTTTTKVQEVIAAWIESGGTLDELSDGLETIFNDPARAHLIAQTESTRAYAEGSNYRWQEAGVTKTIWRTVNDSAVCPACIGKNGQEFEIDDTANTPPLHPGCRCYRVPKV